MRKKVFIAGPYSERQEEVEATGAVEDQNVMNALRAADELFNLGYVPFVPHLFHFWHYACAEHPRIEWMKMDLEWLTVCDAIYRMPGDSKGADREVATAIIHGIPVFRTTEDLLKKLPPR